MSLIEEVRTVRQRIVARLRELEPLVREYEQLRRAAAEMGIDESEITEVPLESRERTPRRTPRQRPRAGQRRPSRARARSADPLGEEELGDRVLEAVRANPGQTVTEYARVLDLAPTAIYRPIRELTTAGAIVKRARELYPAG
jgi:hypothetical protein